MQKDTVIGGRFELLTQAGKGGMASVYKARDLETSGIVAVKVLTLDRPFDVARFQREATVLATMQHPNVVRYIAHGQATGVHFLAQEWVDGDTLAVYLKNHGATVRDAVTIAIGVAGALASIHELGVIHRDVKPSNIILANGKPDGVKLVDFGIARAAADAGLLTRSGVMLGTPSYMSPEQAQGLLSIEPVTDVWALGCVLFEALTGRTAFAGKTPAAIRAKVLLADPPALLALCPEAPPELCLLVGHMLEKRESRRPADGAALLDRLRALPPIPDGPCRRAGKSEPPTVAMPVRRHDAGAANCFVFLAPAEEAAAVTPASAKVAQVAASHAMDLHTFDDGSALMVSRESGKAAAIEAARAALDLRDQVFDGAVSVFGQAFADTLSEAIDRGSALLDRAMVGTLFGDIVGAGPVVHIDDVIADLIANDLPVEKTDEGPVLRAGIHETSNGG
jgi:hypothetical protein